MLNVFKKLDSIFPRERVTLAESSVAEGGYDPPAPGFPNFACHYERESEFRAVTG